MVDTQSPTGSKTHKTRSMSWQASTDLAKAMSFTSTEADALITPAFLMRTGRATEYATLMGCIALCWFGVTVPSPFLLPYAIEKHIPESTAGALFAMQPFAVVLVQPLVSCLGERVGYRCTQALGLLLGGLAMAFFASAPMLAPKGGDQLFRVLLSAALLAGMGEGVVETSTFAILQQVFPDVMGQVAGHAEAWIGIGTVAGPALGGALFAAGGFGCPTAFTSILMLFLGVCSLIRAGKEASQAPKNDLGEPLMEAEESHGHGTRSPDALVFITVALGNIMGGAVAGAFCPITSDYYIEKYGWSTAITGMVFGGFGAVYMVTAMSAGIVVDRGPMQARIVFCVGGFVSAASMLVAVWPSSLVSVLGVQLVGAGTGFIMVPVLSLLSQSAPDGSSEGFTASILNAGYAFGLGAGPLLVVPLFNAWGYQRAVSSMAFVVTVLSLVITFVMCVRRPRSN